MHNTTECQQKLIELGYLSARDPVTDRPSDDGIFGARSFDAYNRYRKVVLHAPASIPPIHLDALNADLFPLEQPVPKPRLTPNPVVQWIAGIAANYIVNNVILKGTGVTMDLAKISKAIAAAISGAGIGGGAAAYTYVSLPATVAAQLPSWVSTEVPIANAVIGAIVGFLIVYFAPANKAA